MNILKLRRPHYYLRRFCSKQVQVLLERMDNHYADEFYGYDSKWEPLVGHNSSAWRSYTRVEQYCIKKTEAEQNTVARREQVLSEILMRTVSPTKTNTAYMEEARGGVQIGAMRGGRLISPAMIAQEAQKKLEKAFDSAYQQYAGADVQRAAFAHQERKMIVKVKPYAEDKK